MKTKCTFLPFAAIRKKRFISFLFHVPATLYIFSCALVQEVRDVIHNIYTTFWLILRISTPTNL